MATSAVAGYSGEILFSTATGGSLTKIAEIRNFNLTLTHAEIDVTSHDSSGAREVIGGVTNWAGTADYLNVVSNATHKAVFDLVNAKTKLDMEFYPTGSSSDGLWGGSGFLTSWDVASPNADATLSNLSFVGTEALTRSSSST